MLDETTEILPEELTFLKRTLHPGSRRQTDGSERWRKGDENVRTCSALQNGLGDGAQTGFESECATWKAAICALLEEDDKNCAKQDGEGVAEVVEHLDFMGHGCCAPSASQTMHRLTVTLKSEFPSHRRVNSYMEREVTVKANRPGKQQSSELSPGCRDFMVLLPKVAGGERTINCAGNFPPQANKPRWLLFPSHMSR